MIVDARSLSDGTVVDSEVCVVGAGAAGIALATELARRGVSVCLLDSGGLEYDEEAQALCAAEETGARGDLDFNRLRGFGGTTGHWGGNCAPFEAHDFEERPWVPASGWPFPTSTLAPFYRRAAAYCELRSDSYDADAWAQASPEFGAAKLPLRRTALAHKILLRSPPTRFGEAHRAALEAPSSTARVFLHAHATELETDPGGTRVAAVRTTDLRGRTHRFRAGVVVLAAGPENSRLMLLSRGAHPNGIGNGHDLVGRYFMGHIRVRTGRLLLAARPEVTFFYDAVSWRSHLTGEEPVFYSGIQASPETQRKEGMLNCTAFLEAAIEGKTAPGFTTLRRMARKLRRGEMPEQMAQDVSSVIADIDRIGYVLYQNMSGTPAGEHVAIDIRYMGEQSPNRDSRLTLGSELDPVGQPKLRMEWRDNEIDKLSIIRMQDLIAREFGRLGIGRLQAEFTSPDQPWPGLNLQAHYMGGTRMHRDPRQGVVDENCRVHGVGNLFVAGGSVFPTSGATMPTANIVALAIRLADHLVEAA
jgi:choline dehydrogenase-like flavoprotein